MRAARTGVIPATAGIRSSTEIRGIEVRRPPARTRVSVGDGVDVAGRSHEEYSSTIDRWLRGLLEDSLEAGLSGVAEYARREASAG